MSSPQWRPRAAMIAAAPHRSSHDICSKRRIRLVRFPWMHQIYWIHKSSGKPSGRSSRLKVRRRFIFDRRLRCSVPLSARNSTLQAVASHHKGSSTPERSPAWSERSLLLRSTIRNNFRLNNLSVQPFSICLRSSASRADLMCSPSSWTSAPTRLRIDGQASRSKRRPRSSQTA